MERRLSQQYDTPTTSYTMSLSLYPYTGKTSERPRTLITYVNAPFSPPHVKKSLNTTQLPVFLPVRRRRTEPGSRASLPNSIHAPTNLRNYASVARSVSIDQSVEKIGVASFFPRSLADGGGGSK